MAKDENENPENFVKRDPIQRRLFNRIMELVKRLEIPTKLAVIKNIFRSIEKDVDDEDKKSDN